MESNSKFLVTGGSGFIGTNLIKRLSENGAEVISIDIEKPQDESLNSFHVECDIRNLESLRKVIIGFKPDYVVHLAARTDLNGSVVDDYSANTLGVSNLCECITEVGNVKKTVFASSMLVCKRGYNPFSDSDYCPDTVYGESKVITEKIIRTFSPKLGNHTIIRPTSIWGPWFATPYKDFFDILLANRYFHISNVDTFKTYGYVGNSVNQIISILLGHSFDSGQVVYIGDVEPLNIRVWSDSICYEAGKNQPKVLPYFVFYIAGKFGDLINYFGLSFPMTTFRLNNMTNDNVQDCSLASDNNCFDEIDTKTAIRETLDWINNRG